MRGPLVRCWLLLLATASVHADSPRLDLAWPTPNKAYLEGKPIDDYVQATASGVTTSGLFGCTRSGGQQFHEGLDLKPIQRDKRGEATDDIFATMAGVVRHINTRAGDSNYGRYIVIEHTDVQPPVYSLYAHLSSTVSGLKEGDSVTSGQVIATMGRSSSGSPIPRERAHLHFEIGLLATRQFQSWYNWKKFGSPNEQGIYNGMNLLGIDALDFFTQYRAKRVTGFLDYFAHMHAVARVRIATPRIPDFVQNYPQLLTAEVPTNGVAGWEIKVSAVGIPFAWTPLTPVDVIGYRANEVRLFDVDAEALRQCRCKSIALLKRGKYHPGTYLETVLQLTLGIR